MYSQNCGPTMSDRSQFIQAVFKMPYKFGGRTKEGIDCWGLVLMAYKDLFDIDIPSYEETAWSVSNTTMTAEDIKSHLETSAPFQEVLEPQYGDFVLINILGNPIHIGLMMSGTHMLHISEKVGVAYEDIRGIKWKRRVKGFYRHNQMM